jgi:DNA-binding NarL/FixJ family response regulator
LINAIRGTAEGKSFIDPDVAGKLLASVTMKNVPASSHMIEVLNERELDILRLLARGFTSAEIAEDLSLAQGTAHNYTSTILAKLNVSNRTQAALLAFQCGLVDNNDK